MKCPACNQGVLRSCREDYRYEEYGDPDVVLVRLEVRRCPRSECGEVMPVIPSISPLHEELELRGGRGRFFHGRDGWTALPKAPLPAEAVAASVLRRCGDMHAHKLHKVCYYAQCAHLALVGTPMFAGRFQAWVFGPVHPKIFEAYQGGDPVSWAEMTPDEGVGIPWLSEVWDVAQHFAAMPAGMLIDVARREASWVRARRGYEPSQRCEVEIDEWRMHQRGSYLLNIRHDPEPSDDALLAAIQAHHERDELEFEICRQVSTTFDEHEPSVDKWEMHQDREVLLGLVRRLKAAAPSGS